MTAPPEGDAPTVPPAPPRRRPGCWGLGAITCGSLLLIFAVFLGTVLWLLRPYLADIWESGQLSARCYQNLYAIHGALDRHRASRGAYPAELTRLRPHYLSRAEVLRCPADTTLGPTSYTYTPPPPASRDTPPPPVTPIVTCGHHQLVLKGQRAVNVLELMPDGTIRQKTRLYTDTGRPIPPDAVGTGRGRRE